MEHFAHFISGLLGKPQTIETNLYNDFEIERADVENLHHLIMQRVAQQNESNLVQFTAKIIYHDKSSVLLNSFEDFTTYAEAKPLAPEEVVFT